MVGSLEFLQADDDAAGAEGESTCSDINQAGAVSGRLPPLIKYVVPPCQTIELYMCFSEPEGFLEMQCAHSNFLE